MESVVHSSFLASSEFDIMGLSVYVLCIDVMEQKHRAQTHKLHKLGAFPRFLFCNLRDHSQEVYVRPARVSRSRFQ